MGLTITEREYVDQLRRKYQYEAKRNGELKVLINSLRNDFEEYKTANDIKVAKSNNGFAFYKDNAYTEASPLIISEGNTDIIDINSSFVIEDFLPNGHTTFFNSFLSKILPVSEGDTYDFIFTFKAKTSVSGGDFQIGVDIGGSFGIIFDTVKTFPLGANVEVPFHIVLPGYSGSTFIANGGIPKVTSITGNTSIYDISMQVHLKSRGQ